MKRFLKTVNYHEHGHVNWAISQGLMIPKEVRLNEMGPRDGLQNERQMLSTNAKVQFVQKLATTGLREIEVTSFVSPKWVPQMEDAAQIVNAIRPLRASNPELRFPVLTPNVRGLERALQAGAREVAIFTAASDTFSRRNINCSIDESFSRYVDVARLAAQEKVRMRGYVSTVLGCPYEGPVARERVVEVTRRLLELGCYEISLGDTIGIGTPGPTAALLRELLTSLGVAQGSKLAVHFHDTYGQALGNIQMALQFGIASIDSSVAGLGGCPYARGASGNVVTEDVVYMLHGMGIETGVDLEQLVDVGEWICAALGRKSMSKVGVALTRRKLAKTFDDYDTNVRTNALNPDS